MKKKKSPDALSRQGSRIGRVSRKVPEPGHFLPQYSVFTKHFYNPLELNEQFLRELYVDKKLSASQIAKIMGRAKSTILKALKQCGIPRRAILENLQLGLRHGNVIPYGKRVEKGRVVDNKKEQKVIEMIKDLRSRRGYNFNQIVNCLNENSIPTKTMKPKWNANSVKSILAKIQIGLDA